MPDKMKLDMAIKYSGDDYHTVLEEVGIFLTLYSLKNCARNRYKVMCDFFVLFSVFYCKIAVLKSVRVGVLSSFTIYPSF